MSQELNILTHNNKKIELASVTLSDDVVRDVEDDLSKISVYWRTPFICKDVDCNGHLSHLVSVLSRYNDIVKLKFVGDCGFKEEDYRAMFSGTGIEVLVLDHMPRFDPDKFSNAISNNKNLKKLDFYIDTFLSNVKQAELVKVLKTTRIQEYVVRSKTPVMPLTRHDWKLDMLGLGWTDIRERKYVFFNPIIDMRIKLVPDNIEDAFEFTENTPRIAHRSRPDAGSEFVANRYNPPHVSRLVLSPPVSSLPIKKMPSPTEQDPRLVSIIGFLEAQHDQPERTSGKKYIDISNTRYNGKEWVEVIRYIETTRPQILKMRNCTPATKQTSREFPEMWINSAMSLMTGSLEELDFSDNPVSPTFLRHISKNCVNLTHLSISVSFAGKQYLRPNELTGFIQRISKHNLAKLVVFTKDDVETSAFMIAVKNMRRSMAEVQYPSIETVTIGNQEVQFTKVSADKPLETVKTYVLTETTE